MVSVDELVAKVRGKKIAKSTVIQESRFSYDYPPVNSVLNLSSE